MLKKAKHVVLQIIHTEFPTPLSGQTKTLINVSKAKLAFNRAVTTMLLHTIYVKFLYYSKSGMQQTD